VPAVEAIAANGVQRNEGASIEMSHDRTLTRPDALPEAARDPLVGGQAVADATHGPSPAPLSPSGDAVVWAWATEHSAPERASAQQLVSWLARGELAAHTLVWRPGWGEWLPALQVAELAAAFPNVTPGNWRVAQAAPAGASMPPVPVGHYPRLRLLAKDVVTGSGPFTAVSQGLGPARAGRRSLRDLDELQQDVVTSQVPAAAMLQAARAMTALSPAGAPSRAERWGRLDLGTFGEPPPRSSAGERMAHTIPEPSRSPAGTSPPGRTLSPHALELDFSTLAEPELEVQWGTPRRYGPWLVLGLLVGSVLGLLAIVQRSPEAAVLATRTSVPRTPDEGPRPPPFRAAKTAGIDELEHEGRPALLRALSVAPHEGFDRAVFEFRERVPSFQVESVDGPSRACSSGEPEPIAGSWLEVRFRPASAAEAGAAFTAGGREPRTIRAVEKTCDSGGVVTWAIGSASAHRFRAFELADPPRLIVDIEH
jgi:hypothetical protein